MVESVAQRIAEGGRTVVTTAETLRLTDLDVPVCPDVASLARSVDLLLVFGGDGTMLGVARSAAGSMTPILGVNVGGLGFLTEVPGDQAHAALEKIWAGQFTLEKRPLIEARTVEAPRPQYALNDFVINRGATSRLIELEVGVDDEVLTRYRCDGLIVCSPTGSTAYSLAAGGAIVSPGTDALTITPICPHTLSNRSVIVGFRSTVRVKVMSTKLEVFLSADGQVQSPLRAGESVAIKKSSHSVRLVRLPGSSFFKTLRQKLNWSGSNYY